MYFQKFASVAKIYVKKVEEEVKTAVKVNSYFDNHDLNFFCEEILNFLRFIRQIFEMIIRCFKPIYTLPLTLGGGLFRAKVNINVHFHTPTDKKLVIPPCHIPNCSECHDHN
ncbi:hypothetical protein ACKWTF_015093 [Chironomus riparius]